MELQDREQDYHSWWTGNHTPTMHQLHNHMTALRNVDFDITWLRLKSLLGSSFPLVVPTVFSLQWFTLSQVHSTSRNLLMDLHVPGDRWCRSWCWSSVARGWSAGGDGRFSLFHWGGLVVSSAVQCLESTRPCPLQRESHGDSLFLLARTAREEGKKNGIVIN